MKALYAYLNWALQLQGGVWSCRSKLPIGWAAVMMGCFLVLGWAIALKFAYLPTPAISRRHEYPDAKTIWWCFHTLAFAPVAEQWIFRAPILWLCICQSIRPALAATILIMGIFGTMHRLERIRYADGTKAPRPWRATFIPMFTSLACSCLVIASRSLWPAICFHSLWNLSGILCENKFFSALLIVIAEKWQRPIGGLTGKPAS